MVTLRPITPENRDAVVALRAAARLELLTTSAGHGEGSPIPFDERDGFVRTGEIVFDDEVLLRLRLR